MPKTTALSLPRIIIHNAASIDNRITGFDVELGTYYGLVPMWHEDATLVGSGTILASPEGRVRDKPGRKAWVPKPGDKRPLLVVADSRGRVRCWQTLRRAGYWRDAVALLSERTPESFRRYLRDMGVDCIVAGRARVDLRSALGALRSELGVRTVRCDSGGELNGALLRAGLVDEVSLLVHPALAGERAVPMFCLPGKLKRPFKLKLLRTEKLEHGLVWLRYRVARD